MLADATTYPDFAERLQRVVGVIREELLWNLQAAQEPGQVGPRLEFGHCLWSKKPMQQCVYCAAVTCSSRGQCQTWK